MTWRYNFSFPRGDAVMVVARRFRSATGGFTLVELLVVLAILTLLARVC
jgi:prepilin-type N-terminal cleavage/methylation domain-containing protein